MDLLSLRSKFLKSHMPLWCPGLASSSTHHPNLPVEIVENQGIVPELGHSAGDVLALDKLSCARRDKRVMLENKKREERSESVKRDVP